ncbi:60S ribosomal protein L24, partial [Haplosporangium sp. Z 11]
MNFETTAYFQVAAPINRLQGSGFVSTKTFKTKASDITKYARKSSDMERDIQGEPLILHLTLRLPYSSRFVPTSPERHNWVHGPVLDWMIEICAFSGAKIYPGKGKIYVRVDSRSFRFVNGKAESLFLQRKNPRKISWTVLFRRMHKKGISEEVSKKRTRRTVKHQRAVVGASWEAIRAKRNQKPE